MEAAAFGGLGTAYMDISGELQSQSAEYHTQAMAALDRPMGGFMAAMTWAEIGFCMLATGDVEAAGDLLQKGLTVSTMLKNLIRPQLLVGAAFVSMSKGDLDGAAKLIQEASEFAEERAMKQFLPFVAFAEAQVGAAGGDTERALDRFGRTEELASEMLMRPLIWQARAGAAKVLSSLGREIEAQIKRTEAGAMIDEIARPVRGRTATLDVYRKRNRQARLNRSFSPHSRIVCPKPYISFIPSSQSPATMWSEGLAPALYIVVPRHRIRRWDKPTKICRI